MKSILSIIFCLTFFNNIDAQCEEIQINPITEYLAAGMYSYFEVKHCGGHLLEESDVKVFQYSYRIDSVTNDYLSIPIAIRVEKHKKLFRITPKHPGLIDIKILFEGVECTKTLKVKPLPVEASLSLYTNRSKKKISVGEFKAQQGLLASVVNFDISARCLVEEFELVRIPRDDFPMRHLNKKGRFDEKSRTILNETKGGDLYLFRDILAKCPGDLELRHLEDMSFEIAESVFQIDSTFYPNGYKIKNQIDVGNGDTIRLDYFTGKYEVLSSLGIKKSEGSYYAKFSCEPEKNGTWIERYSNGTIKTIGSYLSSRKMNTWIYFYDTGIIKKIENYALPYPKFNNLQLPLLEGPYTEFHENGEKKLNGEYIILDKHFTSDTSYVINYETYEESIKISKGDFWKPVSLKSGRWIFYDKNGEMVRIEMERPDLGEYLRNIE